MPTVILNRLINIPLLTTIAALLIPIVLFAKRDLPLNEGQPANKIVREHRNVFEMQVYPPDTFYCEDPFTGESTRHVAAKDPLPIKLNGHEIYNYDDINGFPEFKEDAVEKYLLNRLTKELKKLGNGAYRFSFSNTVINSKGKLVYFYYDKIGGPFRTGCHSWDIPGNEELRHVRAVDRKIMRLMKKLPPFKPATINGKPIAFIYEGSFFNCYFEIRDGKLFGF